MTQPKSKGRGTFPWEYDAPASEQKRLDEAVRFHGRRKVKALSKVEKSKQRARRAREQIDRPMDAGQPKMIKPWPQSWRVPTAVHPLSAKEYALYLETPHWQEFRDRYRASNLLQECFVCGSPEFELHHHTYSRVGNEGLLDVVPLCDTHHRSVHKTVKAGVSLTSAHTYVKMRYTRNELGVRTRSLKTETE
jgi:hypothetical protein